MRSLSRAAAFLAERVYADISVSSMSISEVVLISTFRAIVMAPGNLYVGSEQAS